MAYVQSKLKELLCTLLCCCVYLSIYHVILCHLATLAWLYLLFVFYPSGKPKRQANVLLGGDLQSACFALIQIFHVCGGEGVGDCAYTGRWSEEEWPCASAGCLQDAFMMSLRS